MNAVEVLKTIQKKNSVNKDDLNKILGLSGDEQLIVIKKISKTRQKKLLEYLANIPYLEDSFNFPLSRRESFNPSPNNKSMQLDSR